jgi:hypothetical protein
MVTLGVEAAYGIILLVGVAAGSLFTALITKQRRVNRERGMTLLVALNSNNQTVKLYRIPTKDCPEGWQIPGGAYVKFEGSRTYIDRDHSRPLVVANADTGFALKATTGEASEMDGLVYSAALLSHDWEGIQRSHGGIPWVPLAIIAGLVVVFLPVAAIAAFKAWGG